MDGVLTVLAGIFLYSTPLYEVYDFIAPICLLLGGGCQTAAALQLRRHISGSWSLILAGSASLVFGFGLLLLLLRQFFFPRYYPVYHYIDWLVGLYGLVAGALLIAAGLAIRGKKA